MENLDRNKYFIINKKSEEKMTFFLMEDSVFCKATNKNSIDPKETLIDDVKSFDIDLDDKENIHIVFITNRGELGYLHNVDKKWHKKVLKKFNPKSNTVDFVNMLVANNEVHIFYSFKNIINKHLYKIIHLYNNGLKWTYSHLDSIPQIKDIHPYIIDYDTAGNVYFLYKKPSSKRTNLYLRIFSIKSKNWRTSSQLNFNMDLHDIKLFLVDSKLNYHLFYISNKNLSELYHISKRNNGSITTPYLILPQCSQSISYKAFELDDKIWFSWDNANSISYKSSSDFGMNWSESNTLNLDNFNSIDFIGSQYKSKNIEKKFSTYGYLKDDDIYLLGFDKLIPSNPEEKEELDTMKNITENNSFPSRDNNVNNIEESPLDEPIDGYNSDKEELVENKSLINKIISFLNNK